MADVESETLSNKVQQKKQIVSLAEGELNRNEICKSWPSNFLRKLSWDQGESLLLWRKKLCNDKVHAQNTISSRAVNSKYWRNYFPRIRINDTAVSSGLIYDDPTLISRCISIETSGFRFRGDIQLALLLPTTCISMRSDIFTAAVLPCLDLKPP